MSGMKRELTAEEKTECAKLKAIFLRVQNERKARNESKLTQDVAAHALGYSTQGAISQYLNGSLALNITAAIGFAKLLNCTVADFSPRLAAMVGNNVVNLHKVEESKSSWNIGNTEPANGPYRSFLYPEISAVSAGNAIEAIDLLQPGEGIQHQSDAWAGPHGFWLRITGDSMTAIGGVSFPQGMLVLVAPELEPESGQFIVAKISNDVTFKQYIVDAGVRYLKPLNPSYQQQVMDDRWRVVGTVLDAKWPKSIF